MNNVIKELSLYGLVPVIKIERLEDAVPLAQALCKGGLPVAEVTFRTSLAKEAIKAMKEACPQMIIGAGTVLNAQQVDEAIDAGSEFIVSPGLNPKTVSYCLDKNIPILPGCANPSDMELALELGLNIVKFFPAEANGGLPAIKAMAAPYGDLKFMPTGGINPSNLTSYLAFDKIIACGGTWMVSDDLVNNKKWDEITAITKQAIASMLDIKFHHVGICTNDNGSQLASLINEPYQETLTASTMVDQVEFMFENNATDSLHHLCLSTKNIERAIFFLEKQGYTFDSTTIRYNHKNKIEFIYFNELISGCKCHLRLEG